MQGPGGGTLPCVAVVQHCRQNMAACAADVAVGIHRAPPLALAHRLAAQRLRPVRAAQAARRTRLLVPTGCHARAAPVGARMLMSQLRRCLWRPA